MRSKLSEEQTNLAPELEMAGSLELQFEVIRMIAASLISVAIVLLWFLAISRQ